MRSAVLALLVVGRFPRDRVNPNGGSLALGHPFAATGARILSQAVKELARHGPRSRTGSPVSPLHLRTVPASDRRERRDPCPGSRLDFIA